MSKRVAALCIVAPLLLAGAPALAAATAETVGELSEQCKSVTDAGPQSVAGMQCLAYIIGIFDAMRSLAANVRDPMLCPPWPTDDAEFARAFRSWAGRYPHRAADYPATPVMDMLEQNFRCRGR